MKIHIMFIVLGSGRYVFAEGTVSPTKLQAPMTVASWPCVVHRVRFWFFSVQNI